SEAELPGDYDPPYRLAMAAREAGRLDEALAAVDRALALGYGARKLRMYALKASVQERQGDRAGQRATLEAGVAYARGLPPGQLRRGERATLEKLQKALDGLDGAG
ncbi:MAG TPA: thiol reductase thioredoxin, partial [Anaeromyxobacteraceae bacterium]|nr:thiol reductase thioredoxin [Anaeromyxobacteraceae bacterium]